MPRVLAANKCHLALCTPYARAPISIPGSNLPIANVSPLVVLSLSHQECRSDDTTLRNHSGALRCDVVWTVNNPVCLAARPDGPTHGFAILSIFAALMCPATQTLLAAARRLVSDAAATPPRRRRACQVCGHRTYQRIYHGTAYQAYADMSSVDEALAFVSSLLLAADVFV